MTFYIDALLPTNCTIVAFFRERQQICDLTFGDLTNFAKSGGEAICAHVIQYKPSRNTY